MKQKERDKKSQEKGKNSSQLGWAAAAFCMAVSLSAALSLSSQSLLEEAGLLVAIAVLAAFILLGIVFDVVGVAVTAADAKPLHSMAAHRERGAKEALALMKNASRVSSVCNDVVGDICGIVSGVTGAVIVTELQTALNSRSILVSVAVTALISGLTIGGKALSKTFAIREATRVVWWAGRFLSLFHRHRFRLPRRRDRRGREERIRRDKDERDRRDRDERDRREKDERDRRGKEEGVKK